MSQILAPPLDPETPTWPVLVVAAVRLRRRSGASAWSAMTPIGPVGVMLPTSTTRSGLAYRPFIGSDGSFQYQSAVACTIDTVGGSFR
jgi:hypothetical protein